MRICYSGADPSENSGCTELLSGVVVLNWNKQAVSAVFKLWMLSQISMMSSLTGQFGAPKSDLLVGTAAMYQGLLT